MFCLQNRDWEEANTIDECFPLVVAYWASAAAGSVMVVVSWGFVMMHACGYDVLRVL